MRAIENSGMEERSSQKTENARRAVTMSLARLMLLLILLIACKAVSLPAFPVARVALTQTPTQTASPSLTATPLPTLTATASPTPVPPTATPTVTASPTALPSPTPQPTDPSTGVRLCAYVPGVSTPAQMPPGVMVAATPTLFPTPTLPASSPVDASLKDQELKVFRQVWTLVNTNYVYRDFNGLNWKAVGDKYEKLIDQGLAQDDFYAAMSSMVDELGDDHSAFLSPKDVKALANEIQGKTDFVGIGGFTDLTIPGRLVMTAVLPGSPAEEAGLQPHDIILQVDGGPVLDENRQPRTLGEEGTPVTITVQTPGQPPRDLRLIRRRITSQPKVDYCLVRGTHIGYIHLYTYADTTIVNQTYDAIQKMTADHPLDGLILDNRYNSGGLISVLTKILSLFTTGRQGDFIGGNNREPYTISPVNINGSQSVPLVVLTGSNTQSAAEYASGILRNSRHARLVGEPTGGHVEELLSYNLEDGSQLNLAFRTFQPIGLANNVWEKKGVIPDVLVPERWDLFTEANDPAMGKAIDLLEGK